MHHTDAGCFSLVILLKKLVPLFMMGLLCVQVCLQLLYQYDDLLWK